MLDYETDYRSLNQNEIKANKNDIQRKKQNEKTLQKNGAKCL